MGDGGRGTSASTMKNRRGGPWVSGDSSSGSQCVKFEAGCGEGVFLGMAMRAKENTHSGSMPSGTRGVEEKQPHIGG